MNDAAADALRPTDVEVHLFRHPVATPVRTSFGVMHHRPALLLRVRDADGAHGWGEVWCNFPACGAEHRAQLMHTVLAPLLVGRSFDSPRAAFDHLTEATAVLALQSGEHGPFAQAIAGLDLALWDLLARRRGLPLWQLLGGSSDRVAVYASGINPQGVAATVERQRAAGYRAYKLKVGFGFETDRANLQQLQQAAGAGAALMVDANQAWDLPAALAMAPLLAGFGLGWIEEPLRCDRPWSEWQALSERTATPLAAGENTAGDAAFDALLASGAVGVVQPDVAKWGGISGCQPVVRRVQAAGLRYCPHYLGGGVGLLHSAHLLAACDTAGAAGGMLEVDANPNPLRSLLCGALADVSDGSARLGHRPGIGIEPDLAALRGACGG